MTLHISATRNDNVNHAELLTITTLLKLLVNTFEKNKKEEKRLEMKEDREKDMVTLTPDEAHTFELSLFHVDSI